MYRCPRKNGQVINRIWILSLSHFHCLVLDDIQKGILIFRRWKVECGILTAGAFGFLAVDLPSIYPLPPFSLSLFLEIVFIEEMWLNGYMSCRVSHGLNFSADFPVVLTWLSAVRPINW